MCQLRLSVSDFKFGSFDINLCRSIVALEDVSISNVYTTSIDQMAVYH